MYDSDDFDDQAHFHNLQSHVTCACTSRTTYFILLSEHRPLSCSKPLEYDLSFKLLSEVQKFAKLKSLESENCVL